MLCATHHSAARVTSHEAILMVCKQEQLLQLRQLELRLRSAELRVKVSHDMRALHGAITLADRVYQGYLWLRERPYWLLGGAGGAASIVALLRPRRLLRWAAKGFWAWRLFKRFAVARNKR
jgi:hypothetical protein